MISDHARAGDVALLLTVSALLATVALVTSRDSTAVIATLTAVAVLAGVELALDRNALVLLDNDNNPRGTYSSGNSPQQRPEMPARRNSAKTRNRAADAAEQGLLSPGDSMEDDYDGDTDLDLPPAARRLSPRGHSPTAAAAAAAVAAMRG